MNSRKLSLFVTTTAVLSSAALLPLSAQTSTAKPATPLAATAPTVVPALVPFQEEPSTAAGITEFSSGQVSRVACLSTSSPPAKLAGWRSRLPASRRSPAVCWPESPTRSSRRRSRRGVPEAVTYEANGKDARAVAYNRLTALLIEATKQQQAEVASALRQIHSPQKLIQKQNADIAALKAEVRSSEQNLRQVQRQLPSGQVGTSQLNPTASR